MSTSQFLKEPVHFPVILSHGDRQKTISDAAQIVLELRPEWKTKSDDQKSTGEVDSDSLKYQYFTEGTTNSILSIWSTVSGPDDRILLRIYGEKTELLIDRQAERQNMILLNRHGCAAQLYATFENGIVCGYVPGRILHREDISESHFLDLIARRMAKMHTVGYPIVGQCNPIDPDQSHKAILMEKLTSYLSNLPSSFDDPDKQLKFVTQFPSLQELQAELDCIREKVESLKSPVVLCQNDLSAANTVYDQNKDDVNFIDLEYAAYNFQAFDIGNHFNEYAGVENMDFSLFPNEDHQRFWLKQYLHYWREFTKGPAPIDRDVDNLYIQTNVFAAVAQFWWSVWGVIQARHSTIDFDFLQNAIERMTEYKRLKEQSWKWTIKDD